MAHKKKANQKPPQADAEQSRTPHTRERNAQQLERQEQVFRRRVIECKTVRAVAEEMQISLETVINDTRAELQRRADEIAERREIEKAAHLAMVEDLYRISVNERSVPGSGALGAAGKALEMRAKILGLDAPTKVEVGIAGLVSALDGE